MRILIVLILLMIPGSIVLAMVETAYWSYKERRRRRTNSPLEHGIQ